MLILSDLIDEVKEKEDSSDQGLNEIGARNNNQEFQLNPHMEYISRHVYHRVPKEKNHKNEKKV